LAIQSKPLILCGGLPSSGSTVVSWCFLQRADTDGRLDDDNDRLPRIPDSIDTPNVWCKTTISSFNLCELIEYFEYEGWSVRPLLVLRDVREVWSSISGRGYGRNGTTAEDPPLRLRLMRFLRDFQTFAERGWTTIRFESLVEQPVETLQSACQDLGLPWDQAMVDWTKPVEKIADISYGSGTFRRQMGKGLVDTIDPKLVGRIKKPIGSDDLDWMESVFGSFNRQCGYPEHRQAPRTDVLRDVPSYKMTRRYMWKMGRKPFRWMRHWLGIGNENEDCDVYPFSGRRRGFEAKSR